MSADALTKRIVKITNKTKMQSLVQIRRISTATWHCIILLTLVSHVTQTEWRCRCCKTKG